MSGKTRVLLLTAVLAIAAVGVGCGGGGDGDSGSDSGGGGAALTKASYIAKGERICRNIPVRYRELIGTMPANQRSNPRQTVPTAAVPPLHRAADEFEDLSSPEGHDQQAEELVAALEKAAKGLEEEPLGELSGPQSSLAEFQKAARDYGFRVCNEL